MREQNDYDNLLSSKPSTWPMEEGKVSSYSSHPNRTSKVSGFHQNISSYENDVEKLAKLKKLNSKFWESLGIIRLGDVPQNKLSNIENSPLAEDLSLLDFRLCLKPLRCKMKYLLNGVKFHELHSDENS